MTSMGITAQPGARWGRRGAGALAGLLAAAVALGVAELVASAVGASSSPVIAVGQAVIAATPEPVKEFAIRTFGQNDKAALVVGVCIVLALFAVLLGLATLRKLAYGIAGIAVFGVVGMAAAITRHDAGPLAALPSLIGAFAGMVALMLLARPLRVGVPGPAGASAPPVAPPDTAGAIADAPVADDDVTARHARTEAVSVVGARTAGASSSLDTPSHVADGRSAGDAADAAEPVADDEQAADGGPPSGGEPPPGPGRRPTADESTPDRPGIDRRGFVLTGLATLGVAALAGGVGRAITFRRDVGAARASLALPKPASPAAPLPPGAELRVPRLTPFYTSPRDFYRVDTSIVAPQVNPDTWKLRIHGQVRNPMTIDFAQLLRRPMIERDITLACVSNEVGGNLNGNARWIGAPLKPLLDEVGPADGADQIVTRSADGWTCGTPTAACRDGRDAMLAVGLNGEPLPVEHGFPVRMIVPGLYGYVSATKWIVDMELSRFGDFDPYWIKRGWARPGPIKTFSRIDTPGSFQKPKAGRVVVAGIAYAQHRGIEKVEVRVDGGQWQTATLAAEDTIDTWRQWSLPWQATKGRHTLECRATDKTGATQPGRRQEPFPSGATGWHSLEITIV